MKQDRFSELHEGEWRSFERLLDQLEGKRAAARWPDEARYKPGDEPRSGHEPADDPGVVPAAGALPELYRAVSQQLALARRRGYSLGLIERLEQLAFRGHQRLYERRVPLGRAISDFVRRGFPRRFRAEGWSLGVAALVFFGTIASAAGLVVSKPELMLSIMDPAAVERLEAMYDPGNARRLGRERESADDLVMFGFYVRNNTGIGFQTFAGGLLFGLGTLFFLIFNGLHVGAAAGHLSAGGFGVPFWSFVSGHSPYELTAIVTSGAAGLRVGASLLWPGPRTRVGALVAAGRASVGLIYGAALLFLIAAFVEAFWSSLTSIPPLFKYIVGALGWIGLASYLLVGGRGDRA